MKVGTLKPAKKTTKKIKTPEPKKLTKTLIALYGISNQGKTTTIRRVYDDLRLKYRVVRRGSPSRTEVNGAILDIDGVLVGFASPGDVEWILAANLLPLIEKGCIVILCATHTRGGTVDLVERVAADHQFATVWIEKAGDSTDHIVANRRKADEIIQRIRRAVEEA